MWVVLVCGAALGACAPPLEWAVVRDSADRSLWQQCVEGRACQDVAYAAQDGRLPKALTKLLRETLMASQLNPDLVAYLLQQGADPNSEYSGLPVATYLLGPSDGRRPSSGLVLPTPAGSGGSLRDEASIIKVLGVLVQGGLDLKADFDASFKSLLFLAVQGGMAQVVGYLVDHGARLKSSQWDSQPIDEAMRLRNQAIIAKLSGVGAVGPGQLAQAIQQGQWDLLPGLCEKVDGGQRFNPNPNVNVSALYLVVSRLASNREKRAVAEACIETLMRRGFDPNEVYAGGFTPFTYCCYSKLCIESPRAMKAFLGKVDPDVLYGGMGRVALHNAVEAGQTEVVGLLLADGINTNLQDSQGSTPLHLAVDRGDANIVRMLLEHGANPALKDTVGRTPLEQAVAAKRKDLVALLASKVKASEVRDAQLRAEQARNKAEADKVLADAKIAAARIEAAPAVGGTASGGEGVDDWVPPGPRREKPAKLPVVAVFDVELKGASMGKATQANLSELLSIQLVETGYFQAVPREDLKKRLTDVKAGSYKPCYDQSCQIELGRELAAEQTLSVKVMKIGDECSSTLTLFDLKKGTAVGAVTAMSRCAEGEVVKTLRRLVDRLTY